VLGLFDKLNFLWLVVAFGGAALAAYGDRVARHLRAAPVSHLALVAGFALVLLLTVQSRVLPAMRLDIPGMPAELDLAAQWRHLWGAYALTFSTVFAHDWIFRNPTRVPLWPLWLLAAQA